MSRRIHTVGVVVVACLLATATVTPYVSAQTENRASPSGDTRAVVNAQITDFQVIDGPHKPGDEVGATVTVENTGDSTHTFFVGYSAIGPDGEYYDNDGQTGRTVTLSPGESDRVYVSWTVEADAPLGEYGVVASVWEESDRDNLDNRLDERTKSNAFTVEEETIDAQVVDFDPESGTYRPGDEVDAEVTVENTGNTEHTFFVGYSVIGSSGDTYDNDDETGETVTLDPGERETITVSWEVTDDVPDGEYDAVASIWEESDRDELYTRLGSEREYGAFDVEEIDIDAELSSVDVQRGTYEPGDTVTATAIVENTGNTEHTYFVGYSVIGPNGNFYDNDEETGRTVTLDPGESRSVGLGWDVPDGAPDGTYDARVSVWQESDRGSLDTRLATSERSRVFDVQTTTIDAALQSVSVSSGSYRVGESVTTTVTVENTGNTAHTFFLGYTVTGPNGGTYDNDEETGQRVTLDPGESRTITLDWTVTDSAPTGSYDARVSVWKESDRDNLQTRLADVRRFDQFSVERVEIDGTVSAIDVSGGTYEAGDEVVTTAVVENTGNTEHTFFVGYSVIGPNGNYYDDDGGTGQTVSLQPGESRSVRLSWTVPEDALDGRYGARVSIWKESDRDNLQTRLGSVERRDSFGVEQTEIDATLRDLSVESGRYRPGDSVDTSVVIENTGNTEHTYFVGYSVTGPNGNFYDNDDETGRTVTLQPGAVARVYLSWVVPEDAVVGSYDARVSVWRESDRDDLQTRLDTTQRGDAFDVAGSEVDASIGSASVSSGTYRSGETVPTTVTITNTGNTEHTYFVGYSVIGPNGNYYDNDDETGRTVTLAPGESRTVTVRWDVPESVLGGTYDARVSVWKESSRDELQTRLDSVQRTRVFTVETEQINASIPALSVSPGTYETGDTVPATVSFKNTGNTEHTFFVGYSVIGPDGETYDNDGETGRTVTLAPGEKYIFVLGWNVAKSVPNGRYDARVSVWKESDRDNLQTRLASRQQDSVFQVDRMNVSARLRTVRTDPGTYRPGESVDTSVVVENTGNTEHTFFVGYSVVGPDGIYYDNQNQTGRPVTLSPGEARSVDLSFDVSRQLSTGEYDVITAVWRESDRNDLRTRLSRKSAEEAFVVKRARPNASVVDVSTDGGNYTVGETVSSTVVVRNTGEEEHTFFVGLSMIGPDGEAYDNDNATGRAVTIQPGESKRVELSFEIAERHPQGTYDLVAAVWAESDRTALETRVAEQTVSGVVEVVSPDALISLDGPFLQSKQVQRGNSTRVGVAIQNDGSTQQSAVVTVQIRTGDGEWETIGADGGRSVRLPADEERSIVLQATIPDDLSTGEHAVRVVVKDPSTGESLATGSTASPLQVREETGVVAVTVLDPSGNEVSGATVTVGAATTTTGTDGVAVFESVAAGRYEVVVTDTAYPDATRVIDVTGSEPTNVEIQLSERSGAITAVDGFPDSIQLDKWYTGTITIENTGDSTAEFVLRGQRPSGVEFRDTPRYTVELEPGEAKTFQVEVRFYGTEATRSLSFVLESPAGRQLDSEQVSTRPTGTGVDVSVVDTDGNPVSGVTADILGTDGGTKRTDAGGSVSFTRLDQTGTVLVKVTDPDAVGVSVVREVELREGEVTTLEVELTTPRVSRAPSRRQTEARWRT
jgi:uncharacterized membrane protein